VRSLRSQARRTPSPNSGWPMAAMAMALGVSLRKPGVYVLNQDQPTPCAADTLRATLLASKVVVALVFVVIPIIFLIAFRLSR
jgi:adenosylcobinamide-phosphate synthase